MATAEARGGRKARQRCIIMQPPRVGVEGLGRWHVLGEGGGRQRVPASRGRRNWRKRGENGRERGGGLNSLSAFGGSDPSLDAQGAEFSY